MNKKWSFVASIKDADALKKPFKSGSYNLFSIFENVKREKRLKVKK